MVQATVRLVNAVFYARHGVMEEEHRLGARFEVDVSVQTDVEQACLNDDLSDTVDYGGLYALVRDVVLKRPCYLIERLAYLIGSQVLAWDPRVQTVEVTVRKPDPPVGGLCARAEVTLQLSR